MIERRDTPNTAVQGPNSLLGLLLVEPHLKDCCTGLDHKQFYPVIDNSTSLWVSGDLPKEVKTIALIILVIWKVNSIYERENIL